MSAARRFLPTDAKDFLRSVVPLGLLALAAWQPTTRIAVLVVLGIGAAIAIQRDAPVRWTWAAGVPVAASLAWGSVAAGMVADVDPASCPDPAAPLVVARIIEAVLVLAVLGVLALVLGASRTSLALRMPARRWIRWAIVGFLVAGPLGLVLGPILAEPFFGDVRFELALAPLVPAAMFAVANGVMEEVAYRGALLHWSARVIGVAPALIGQAIVFGLAHSGSDVIGWPVPLAIAMGTGGLLAGAIAIHTRSLLIPVAVHVGFDLPLYLGLAC